MRLANRTVLGACVAALVADVTLISTVAALAPPDDLPIDEASAAFGDYTAGFSNPPGPTNVVELGTCPFATIDDFSHAVTAAGLGSELHRPLGGRVRWVKSDPNGDSSDAFPAVNCTVAWSEAGSFFMIVAVFPSDWTMETITEMPAGELTLADTGPELLGGELAGVCEGGFSCGQAWRSGDLAITLGTHARDDALDALFDDREPLDALGTMLLDLVPPVVDGVLSSVDPSDTAPAPSLTRSPA